MIRFVIQKSAAGDIGKALGKNKLEELKAEVIKILKAHDDSDIKKAIEYFEQDELKYTHLEKSVTGDWIEKAGYGVGTVRIWKGKKYKKISTNPTRWVRVFDKMDRGAKSSMTRLIHKAQACKTVDELYQFCMSNHSLFQDDNGVDLPIMDKLRSVIDEQHGKIESGKEIKPKNAAKNTQPMDANKVKQIHDKIEENRKKGKKVTPYEAQKQIDDEELMNKVKQVQEEAKNKKNNESGKEQSYSEKKAAAKEGYWSDEFNERTKKQIKDKIAGMREDGKSDKQIKNYLEENIQKYENRISDKRKAVDSGRVQGNEKNDYEDTIQHDTVQLNSMKAELDNLDKKESESEKHQNRSDAMKGNQNAYKGKGDDSKVYSKKDVKEMTSTLKVNDIKVGDEIPIAADENGNIKFTKVTDVSKNGNSIRIMTEDFAGGGLYSSNADILIKKTDKNDIEGEFGDGDYVAEMTGIGGKKYRNRFVTREEAEKSTKNHRALGFESRVLEEPKIKESAESKKDKDGLQKDLMKLSKERQDNLKQLKKLVDHQNELKEAKFSGIATEKDKAAIEKDLEETESKISDLNVRNAEIERDGNKIVKDIDKLEKNEKKEEPENSVIKQDANYSTNPYDKTVISNNFNKVSAGKVTVSKTQDIKNEFEQLNYNIDKKYNRHESIAHVYYDGDNFVSTNGKILKTIKAGKIDGLKTGYVKIDTKGDNISIENIDIDARFPDWKRVVPENNQKITLDNKALKKKIQELKKEGVLSNKYENVSFDIKDGNFMLDGVKVGDASGVNFENGDFITFNADYLLNSLSGDNSVIACNENSTKAVNIGSSTSNNIIMPVRTDDGKKLDIAERRKNVESDKNFKNEENTKKIAANKERINAYVDTVEQKIKDANVQVVVNKLNGSKTVDGKGKHYFTDEDLNRYFEEYKKGKKYLEDTPTKYIDLDDSDLPKSVKAADAMRKKVADNRNAIKTYLLIRDHPEVLEALTGEMSKRGMTFKKSLFDWTTIYDEDDSIESDEDDESEDDFSDNDASQPELFNSIQYKVTNALDEVFGC